MTQKEKKKKKLSKCQSNKTKLLTPLKLTRSSAPDTVGTDRDTQTGYKHVSRVFDGPAHIHTYIS